MAKYRSIGIAGLGLLGGSIALAVKERALSEQVYGYTRSPQTLQKAKERGFIDRAFQDFQGFIRNSEFVILCAPVSINVELAKEVLNIDPCILFTDVGSTKTSIVSTVEQLFPAGHRFCGSHPMAGSEKKGIDFSSPELFSGKTVIVTPVKNADPSAARIIKEFWKLLGGCVVCMEPELHDEICAYTSHFPHLTAFLLVELLSEKIGYEEVRSCIGSGFKDTTRIASSDHEIWAEIFLDNQENMLKVIEEFKSQLDCVQGLIKKKDLNALKLWIEKVKKLRETL